ncbi:hypothetical protein DD235_02365 [Corticimicrobacter populi]|uniref:Uncharacterized protein n=1 Tax=Corticimicrobacter populi TaxID=2175229 RepID=A0A2V1K463_9BURK|nr:hypothetical protein DD235_02365 [Corticimicrobacter populi]
MITWKKHIQDLLDWGMTQSEIAVHIGVSQGRVSQVYRSDDGLGFGFSAGSKLISLHSKKSRSQRRRPAAESSSIQEPVNV